MEHIARFDGRVRFSGFTAEDSVDEYTSLWRYGACGDGYVEVVGVDGQVLQRVAVWADHALYVRDGAEIVAGAKIAFYGRLDHRDRRLGEYRSGAARIAALLKAQGPRERAVLSRLDGTVLSQPGRPRTIGAVVSDGGEVQEVGDAPAGCLIPHGARVAVGDALTHGDRDHHELVALWGRDRFERHLFEELYEVLANQHPPVAPAVLDLIVREAVVDTPDGPRLRPLADFPVRGDL